jgi:hypothetical protein
MPLSTGQVQTMLGYSSSSATATKCRPCPSIVSVTGVGSPGEPHDHRGVPQSLGACIVAAVGHRVGELLELRRRPVVAAGR